MNKVDILTVELSEIQAERFVQFQKYYADFIILIDTGVFELKNGKAIIHKDNDGKLREVEFDQIKYKRK